MSPICQICLICIPVYSFIKQYPQIMFRKNYVNLIHSFRKKPCTHKWLHISVVVFLGATETFWIFCGIWLLQIIWIGAIYVGVLQKNKHGKKEAQNMLGIPDGVYFLGTEHHLQQSSSRSCSEKCCVPIYVQYFGYTSAKAMQAKYGGSDVLCEPKLHFCQINRLSLCGSFLPHISEALIK